jgi:hypothetical protein
MMARGDLIVRETTLKVVPAALLVGLVAISVLSAQSQTPTGDSPSGAQEIAPFRVRSELVLIPALIRDKSGALIYTLSANDFVLTDDGIPQKMTLEQDNGGEPLALVVVMQAGAAQQSTGWHPDKRDAPQNRFAHLPTMVEGIAGIVPYRIAVVSFDSQPKLVQNFTTDMEIAGQALQSASTEQEGDGGAAILDGLGFAVDLLRKQPPQYRRAILLLSETNDRGSLLPLAEAIRDISDTNTTIFSVVFSSGSAAAAEYGHKWLPSKRGTPRLNPAQAPPPPAFIPGSSYATAVSMIVGYMTTGVFGENTVPYEQGGCFAGDTINVKGDKVPNNSGKVYNCLGQLLPPLALAKMAAIAVTDGMRTNVPKTVAELTGGEYFGFKDDKSLEGALATITNHLPNRYVLSFQPHNPHAGIHALVLKLPDYPQLEVTARSSYWVNVEIDAKSATDISAKTVR